MFFIRTIRFKLLFFVVGLFLAAALITYFTADMQLHKIIDKSQNSIFSEKVDTIFRNLSEADERQKTGLVEAYMHDFQTTVLKNLRLAYYTSENQEVYPVIIDRESYMLLHPLLTKDQHSIPSMTENLKKIYDQKNGDFNYSYTGKQKWMCFKHFEPWDWYIIYVVAHDIKYADLHNFRSMFIGTLIIIILITSITLLIVTNQITSPITKLTLASAEMADGNLNFPINIDSNDEVGILSQSFIKMRNSIDEKISALSYANMESDAFKQERLIWDCSAVKPIFI